jgi:tetratricopeptide (TPR) repeat protein
MCWPWWGSCCDFGYWFNTCGFWGYGSPYYCDPYAFYCAPAPIYYTYIVEEYFSESDVAAAEPELAPDDPEAESDVGESEPAWEDAAEPVGETQTRPAGTATLRAVAEFLALGDRAFRVGRYSDAVYAYAKAVELAPDDGVLHLVLSDALFATGDYRYCAFALRRALELDPALVESVVDKHGFYGDPSEFDRQIALLERYVADHFVDDDARLVLAANYLFANRPAQASDLLASAFSLAVRESPAGQVLFKRAQALRQANPLRF